MEGALVSAATGALPSVIGKLAAMLVDDYKRFKVVPEEIKDLSDELVAMDAFLTRMSEEEDPHVQDKVWMNEVRELSYDMEDSIDDFMQNVEAKDTKPGGFMKKIRTSLGQMKARRRIGSEIQGLKKQIVEVGKRNERYKTRQPFSNTKNEVVDPRALAIFEHASKLVGIDEPKDELIKLLAEEDGSSSMQQKLNMVSIVGQGGMGKTTLANQVNQELKGKFDCKAFVSMSRNPLMMNILRTILSEVTGQRYADTEAGSIEQLISKIRGHLEKKRYFMVIDDIWDVKTWDVIMHVFPETSCGGIIITTTRMNDVAFSCRSSFGGHIYNIRRLSMVHSRQLFQRRLFNSEEDCPSTLEKVSDQILKKCDGLPLAIIAISGLLANIGRTEQLWNQVKDSIGRALERNSSVEAMIKILSLSYFDLPLQLKTCLMYMSVYPEDSIIRKKELIRRWIAEGFFIDKEGGYTAYELGERCFNELVNRSLIQAVHLDKYGKVLTCRIHDIILDFLVSKSIEENFVTFVGVPGLTIRTNVKVRRLSLQTEGEGSSGVPTGQTLSHVRSLNVFGNTAEIPSMAEFRHLRVASFQRCEVLKDQHIVNVCRLFQLRYLDIGYTSVKLPEEIGHLRCLEMLDIRGTWVSDLPAGIVNLGKLKHLLVDDRVKFPDGIANMQALETLEKVGVCKQSYNFLQELGQLKNLKKLYLFNMDDVEENREAIATSVGNLCMENLSSLSMVNGHDCILLLLDTWCTSSSRPVKLQKLMANCCMLPKVPDWLNLLASLQSLRLEVRRIGHQGLCILGSLPALLILNLDSTEDHSPFEDRKLTVSDKTGFECLRIFTYCTQEDGMDLIFAAGCMRKLENLVIVFAECSEKESLSTSPGALDFGLENLLRLVTLEVEVELKGMDFRAADQTVKDSLERAVSTHPNNNLTLKFHSGERMTL